MFNLDKDQVSLKTLATDTYDSLYNINSLENIRQEHLNDPTAFLPLNTNISGQDAQSIYAHKESKYLSIRRG